MLASIGKVCGRSFGRYPVVRGPGSAGDRGVDTETQHPTAALEMEPDGPSPRGALTGADGRRLRFCGWTELAAVIEDWRAGVRGARLDPSREEEPR